MENCKITDPETNFGQNAPNCSSVIKLAKNNKGIKSRVNFTLTNLFLQFLFSFRVLFHFLECWLLQRRATWILVEKESFAAVQLKTWQPYDIIVFRATIHNCLDTRWWWFFGLADVVSVRCQWLYWSLIWIWIFKW